MADPRQVRLLDRGVAAWNDWRQANPSMRPDLSGCDLAGRHLPRIDLSRANLRHANLRRAKLPGAIFDDALLRSAVLSEADLTGASLRRTDLRAASLRRAKLNGAHLEGAILRHTSCVETQVDQANFHGAEIYGIAAWRLKGEPADQSNLIVRADRKEPAITVDNLEVAQFVFLLINNRKIREVIDTVGRRSVLLLGRFTRERKQILDALRDELRKHNYVPILFDFDRPASASLTDTIVTLASMARFIVADLTEPASVIQELNRVVPQMPRVPVKPILLAGSKPWAMQLDLADYPWYLPIFEYKDQAHLLQSLPAKVITPAESRAEKTIRDRTQRYRAAGMT